MPKTKLIDETRESIIDEIGKCLRAIDIELQYLSGSDVTERRTAIIHKKFELYKILEYLEKGES